MSYGALTTAFFGTFKNVPNYLNPSPPNHIWANKNSNLFTFSIFGKIINITMSQMC